MRARPLPTRRCARASRRSSLRRSISTRSISSSSGKCRRPRRARRRIRQPSGRPSHRGESVSKRLRRIVIAAALALPLNAGAAGFRATSDAAPILYDAPSARAKPLFVYGRDVPVESLVSVEGWTKVRDAGGTIGWIANRALADKRMLVVRAPIADVRANPEDSATVVFRAEQSVLLELAEPATSAAVTATPGWVKVRHRDGQVGFVRVAQVFGL